MAELKWEINKGWLTNPKEDDQRTLVQEVIEDLYKEGTFVKALDSTGQPEIRMGQQVYKHIDHATPEERAYWIHENGSKSLRN